MSSPMASYSASRTLSQIITLCFEIHPTIYQNIVIFEYISVKFNYRSNDSVYIIYLDYKLTITQIRCLKYLPMDKLAYILTIRSIKWYHNRNSFGDETSE